MNRLQLLITEKMAEGKSYRDIEHDTGVSHVSLSKYHKGSTPDGKNLAVLSKYFRVDFHELLEAMKPVEKQIFGNSIDDQFAAIVWNLLTPSQKQRAVVMLRELQADGEKQDQA